MAEHRTRKLSEEKKNHGNVIKYGDRMRETCIRSKHTVNQFSKQNHENANEYAVDNTTETAREIAHDTVRAADFGVKKAVERGKSAAAKQVRTKKDSLNGHSSEKTAPGESAPITPEQDALKSSKAHRQREPQDGQEQTASHRDRQTSSAETKSPPTGKRDDRHPMTERRTNAQKGKADESSSFVCGRSGDFPEPTVVAGLSCREIDGLR